MANKKGPGGWHEDDALWNEDYDESGNIIKGDGDKREGYRAGQIVQNGSGNTANLSGEEIARGAAKVLANRPVKEPYTPGYYARRLYGEDVPADESGATSNQPQSTLSTHREGSQPSTTLTMGQVPEEDSWPSVPSDQRQLISEAQLHAAELAASNRPQVVGVPRQSVAPAPQRELPFGEWRALQGDPDKYLYHAEMNVFTPEYRRHQGTGQFIAPPGQMVIPAPSGPTSQRAVETAIMDQVPAHLVEQAQADYRRAMRSVGTGDQAEVPTAHMERITPDDIKRRQANKPQLPGALTVNEGWDSVAIARAAAEAKAKREAAKAIEAGDNVIVTPDAALHTEFHEWDSATLKKDAEAAKVRNESDAVATQLRAAREKRALRGVMSNPEPSGEPQNPRKRGFFSSLFGKGKKKK